MKKFLSLVLALIMTMSLVTISAGATEYRDLTDKEEIQYAEAVAVLNRIGVITGYEDGSFRPETELTRGAAAKIIVSLMIGPDAAAALPNNQSPYPDVPAGHTFAGVIGYCKTAGYISGYGDGTFKPANPLTGYAFAKMLLGAVGYKSNIEGFVDTGWTMNVARIGNVAGLFDRLDFDGAAAVTRDEACQLALNTLKATMVDYGGSNTVVSSTGEVLTVQGSKAQYVTSNNRDINANINRRVISATNNELTLEFGEEHFKDLRLEHDKYDPAYDVYGHPSNEWSYKKVTIGTFKLPADFTYTKQMAHLEDSVASKEKALGLRGYDTYSTDHRGGFVNWNTASSDKYTTSPFADATQIVVNGWNARVYNADYKQGTIPSSVKDEGDLFTYDAYEIDKDTKTQAPTVSEICDLTDNGVTVEVYVCPVDADFITHVVVTRTELMKVDRVGSDYVALNKEKPDSRDKDLDKLAGYNDNAIDVDVEDVKDSNYDAYNVLKELKSGDRVAVIPYTTDDGATWEVGEAYVPETVSGKLSRVDIYNNEKVPEGNSIAITVGGTSYPLNQWNKDMLKVDADQIKATRKDVTAYLAKDGTVLWATEIGNSDDWMIVADYYQAANGSGKVVWFAHGYTIGGDEVDVDLGTIRGEAEKYAPGELVQYKIASGGNGEYELRKPTYAERSVKKNFFKTVEPEDAAVGTQAFSEISLKDHEGVYNVAQKFIYTTTGLTNYDIRKVNAQLPVDRYNVDKDGNSASGITVTTATENGTFDWKYTNLYYESPTFVYVGFDSNTGEVETITFVDGKQDVDYADLTATNTYWRNVGTNNDNFVATAAEAYVNDEGKVTTVVIKNDSHEADLSAIRIITRNKGSNNYIGAEGDVDLTGKYYEREYVFGPDFKEEKTGVFDKGYLVGDILTGTEKNGVFYGKKFHGNSYSNKSLDGFYVKGIQTVKTPTGDTIDDYIIVDKTNSTLRTLDREHGVDASDMAIFTNKMVLGDDALKGSEGLILCGGAKIIDVRVGHEGEITKLKDLFDDYNLDTVELKFLLNGNPSSANFRQAYAIVILKAELTKSKAAEPLFDITVDGKNAWDAEAKIYTVTANKGDELDLAVKLTNETKLTKVSYEWEIDQGKLSGDKKSDEVTFTPKADGTYYVTVKVTNTDTTKEIEDYPNTKTLKIVVEKDQPAGQGQVRFKTGVANEGETILKPTFKMDEDGVATIKFQVEAPEFASSATTIQSLKFQIVEADTGDVVLPDTQYTFASADATAMGSGKFLFAADKSTGANKMGNAAIVNMIDTYTAEELVVEVTKVVYDKYDVKVVLGDDEYTGTDLDGMFAGTAKNIAYNGTSVAISMTHADASAAGENATVTGITDATPVTVALSHDGAKYTGTATITAPSGKDYVTVTLDDAFANLETRYTITKASGFPTDLGDDLGNVGLTVDVLPSAGVTGAAGDTEMTIVTTLASALNPATAKAVKITYELKNKANTVVDTVEALFVNDNSMVSLDVATDKVTEDLTLSVKSIEVVEGPRLTRVDLVKVATDGDTVLKQGSTFRLFFSEPLKTGSSITFANATTATTATLTGTIVAGNNYVELTIGSADLGASDTFAISAATLISAATGVQAVGVDTAYELTVSGTSVTVTAP